MTGLAILAAVVALTIAAGLLYGRTNGRFRTSRGRGDGTGLQGLPGEPEATPGSTVEHEPLRTESAAAPTHPALAALDQDPGSRATLVQFSSAFCAPCRATRRILSEVAELVPGVRHVEIDAEMHLDLVRELDIRKTPTTLILDAHGAETQRAAGQPRKADVLAALGHALP